MYKKINLNNNMEKAETDLISVLVKEKCMSKGYNKVGKGNVEKIYFNSLDRIDVTKHETEQYLIKDIN